MKSDEKLCGRIDDHEPHTWLGHAEGYKIEWNCPGTVRREMDQKDVVKS